MLKPIRQSFAKYKGDAVRILSQTPYTVEEAWIGVKGYPDKAKRITTFRDSKGIIIERAFDDGNGYIRNRLYTQVENTIGEDQIVTSTIVKEYKLPKKKLPSYKCFLENFKTSEDSRTTLWTPVKLLVNHFSQNINTDEKVLSQTKITGMEKVTKEQHSITEFAHIINGKVQKTKNKFLRYVVNAITDKVVDGSIVGSKGIKLPKKDSFLPFRVLDYESAKYGLTRRFLKDKKLERTYINIYTNYTPKEDEEGTIALFFSEDGSIRFNKNYKFKSKSKLAETVGHETEHVWQWLLYARQTGGSTIWEIGMAQDFGRLKTKKMRNEAARCTKSICNYVPFNVDPKLYRKNYVERKARNAGIRAKRQYEKEGEVIRNNFPHIPKGLL